MLGRLSWSAIPFDQPIVMGACATVGVVLLAIFILVTVKGWWPYLWREWITSVDHKRIGVMYMILGLLMLVLVFSYSVLMRSLHSLSATYAAGYLLAEYL
jgi:cytochrome o ubiquinol oxidase subunit 1